MSDDGFTVYGDVYGKQLSNDKPPDWLGDVDSHLAATPDRVRLARLHWPERDPGDFDPIGSTGRRIVDRVTGEQFMVCQHDPLQGLDPEQDPTAFFIQNSGQLYFMKPRGSGIASGVGLSLGTFAGVVRQDWRGKPELVGADGEVIDTRLLEGRR
jgi:hypothetical protein